MVINGITILLTTLSLFNVQTKPILNNNINEGIYALSYELTTNKWYGWTEENGFDEIRQGLKFPNPRNYDVIFDGELINYTDLVDIFQEDYGDEVSYRIKLNYSVKMKTSGRRSTIGFLMYDYETDATVSMYTINANNTVSIRGYENELTLVDKRRNQDGTINSLSYFGDNDFLCLGFYVGDQSENTIGLPQYNYADYVLELPYILEVSNISDNGTEILNRDYLAQQNKYYQEQSLLIRDLANENIILQNQNASLQQTNTTLLAEIQRLTNELENNVGRFLESAFDIVDKVLSIEILPNIKLWYIVGIPLVLSVVKFIIGWFR